MAFPKDFIWGVATSSYQIEGETPDAGRGECIWTRFSREPGRISDGTNGLIACDHYHRYPEDIALMRDLGLNGYRLSTSWARVLPDGGTVNPAGLDYYDRVVDACLEAGLRPFVTLYHWDMPTAVLDRGGWASPDSINWFVDFSRVVTERLGDRVKDWTTHNEPWCISLLSYFLGEHAPGERDLSKALTVAHHVLLSHGAAVPVIRAASPGARVGIALNLSPIDSASKDERDLLVQQYQDGFNNRWFLDPIFHGEYPADMLALAGEALRFDPASIRPAAVPIDFLGVNYYTRTIAAYDEQRFMNVGSVRNQQASFTAMDWEIYPQGLTRLLTRVARDYGDLPLYVMENGAAFDDPASLNGVVQDPDRVAYLQGHVAALEQAIAQGAPVKGYFVWSLLDNFEWAFGYSRRFGMVHVDFETQKRTPKSSYFWYRDMIRGLHDAT
ncbi:MAG: beta-glucosidase [Chloroflexi bacterium]|nr:beta-glucosidase [Chloroflexota bacterium]